MTVSPVRTTTSEYLLSVLSTEGVTVVFVYNQIIGLQSRLMYVVKSNTLYIPKYMVEIISTADICN